MPLGNIAAADQTDVRPIGLRITRTIRQLGRGNFARRFDRDESVIFVRPGHDENHQAPTSKLQRSTKHQTSSGFALVQHWSLRIGVSLEAGIWGLKHSN